MSVISENDKSAKKDEFDYLKSLRDTDPICAINYIINNFYFSQEVETEYTYKWAYKGDILILCVLIKKPILSKLIIYYQHSQWQYIRYDYNSEKWNQKICSFLDLQDCVDIFEDKKDRARFIRTIWDCHLNWLLPDKN